MNNTMMDYIYFGNYEDRIDELARIVPEKWTFRNGIKNGILKNYLQHTIDKLFEEDKIIEKDNYAVLNIGLFDEFYQPIYFYLIPNTKGKQKWYLNKFANEYDLGYFGVVERPKRADYFQNPELLIFDANCDINVQYDHILSDPQNVSRLPKKVRDNTNMQAVLIGAIDIMKRRVMENYKIAVPQYFNNKIQLLLPLSLSDTNRPDLALVVTKNKDGNSYQGHTCLTLEMAYNNARLIAKPESNWLIP